MQIFTELNKNPNLSLALGFFDGVHSGHQAVIKSAVDYAKQNGTKSAVITFRDHPCCYFWGVCPKYILTREMREEKIAEFGVDYLYELDFEEISGLTAEDYLKDCLVKNFTPVAISTGWNHNFGYKKSGNPKFLKDNAKKFGYEYFELPPKKYESEIISSTAIRKFLSEGKIEKANSMLGYKFFVRGEVVKGNQIGRTIGFRTANLEYPSELINLPYGVYAAEVQTADKVTKQETTDNSHTSMPPCLYTYYKAVANYGVRPTVSGSKAILEVHILDFDEDIYGETIEVSFEKMLRPERRFNSLDELKEQIKSDIMGVY